MNKLPIFLIFLINIVFCQTYSREKNCILWTEDSSPYHIAWTLEKNEGWVHSLYFEKAIVKTYFKKGPENQINNRFSISKPPYKQTIEFPGYGTYSSTDLSVEILENNILCFCFSYPNNLTLGSRKYSAICVSLMNGLTKDDDKYDYSLIHKL